MAGTQNTTSTSSFATNGFNSFTRATASDGVMFIFQLPAIIFFLDIVFYLSLSHCNHLWENRIKLCCQLQPHLAVPCPPGIPGKRRRRWRYGSSYQQSPVSSQH